MDQPTLSAPQSTADIILIPCVIGWGFQLILFGIATPTAVDLLRNSSIQKLAKYLLAAALLGNLVYTGIVFTDVVVYMVSQDRTTDGLNSYIEVDAISPLIEGLTAAVTQLYLTIRCYYISNKNWLLIAPIGLFGLVGLVASAWTTAWSFGYLHGTNDGTAIWIPTVVLLLVQFLTDLLITAVTSYQLVKMRKGVQSETDELLGGLYRLSFQTGAVPMAATMSAALMYLLTYKTDLLWNLYSVMFAILPSLYVMAFVHCLREQYKRKAEHQSNSSNGSRARRATWKAVVSPPNTHSIHTAHRVPVGLPNKDLELELDDFEGAKQGERV